MSAKLFDLSGRTALVTGSSRGLGRAMAEGLAAAGASVVLHGQDAQRLAAAAEAFRDAGHEARSIRFDIADEAAILEAFAKLDAEGVTIDILVNNAGMQLRKPMLELSTQEWRKIIDAYLDERLYRRARGGQTNGAARARQNRQHRLADERGGARHHRALRRLERRHQAAHARHGGRMGRAWHPGQCDRPGLYDHRHEQGPHRGREIRRLGEGADAGDALGKARGVRGRRDLPRLAASDYVNGQILYVDGGMLAVL